MKFLHYRLVSDKSDSWGTQYEYQLGRGVSEYPRGGITVAYEFNEQHNKFQFQFARCSPLDNYNRKIGRTIATGRLKSNPLSFTGDTDKQAVFLISCYLEDVIDDLTFTPATCKRLEEMGGLNDG